MNLLSRILTARGDTRHRRPSKQMGFHCSVPTARGAARRRVRNERHAFILRAARRGGSHKSPRQPITGEISNLIMHNLFPSVDGVLHNVCTVRTLSGLAFWRWVVVKDYNMLNEQAGENGHKSISNKRCEIIVALCHFVRMLFPTWWVLNKQREGRMFQTVIFIFTCLVLKYLIESGIIQLRKTSWRFVSLKPFIAT
jgi:hypothetical protein